MQKGQSGRRAAPKDMPSSVPISAPKERPAAAQAMPAQRPIDEEAPAKQPSKLKRIGLRVLTILLVIVALAFAYIFLLLGEPDAQVAETSGASDQQVITAPIQAVQVRGGGDLTQLAASFGKPILTLASGAALDTAALYDTAFGGGYARRVTMTYQLEGGGVITLESIRPDTAITLLSGERYTQQLGAQYALAGMDAQYLQGETGALLVARGDGACYALRCPTSALGSLGDLMRLCQLQQPAN